MNKLIYYGKLAWMWISFCVIHPASIKYFASWLKSVTSGSNSALDGQPWITFRSREWLDGFLKKDMTVFEWGSGGSTLYFAQRVKKIISVENDAGWFGQIRQLLLSKKITNCDYFLKPGRPLSPGLSAGSKYLSEAPEYPNLDFAQYCQAINNYPDGFFDLIVIDGRVRNECAKAAIGKVKAGGCILFDNSDRKLYRPGIEALRNFKPLNFYGPGPYNRYLWQTSIFIREA